MKKKKHAKEWKSIWHNIMRCDRKLLNKTHAHWKWHGNHGVKENMNLHIHCLWSENGFKIMNGFNDVVLKGWMYAC